MSGRRAFLRKDYKQAEISFSDAVKQSRNPVISPSERADSLVELARTFRKEGASQKAESLLEEAVGILEQSTGTNFLKAGETISSRQPAAMQLADQSAANVLARALYELSEAYKSSSKFKQAQELLKAAMSSSQVKLADKELREEIAASYVETIRRSGKKEQLAELESGAAQSHATKSQEELKWESTLAQAEEALATKRNFDLAEVLAKDAIAQARKHKMGTAKLAKSLLLLARSQEAAQQLPDAQQTYENAVNILMKNESYELSNNELSTAVTGLLTTIALQRKDKEFEKTATGLVNSLEQVRGPYDLIVNRAQLLRVQALETLGRFEEAASAAKILVKHLEHVPQPPNSTGRLLLTEARSKLAVEYAKLGNWKEAQKNLAIWIESAKEDGDLKNAALQKIWNNAVACFVEDAPPDMALHMAESWYRLMKDQFGEEKCTFIAGITKAAAYARAGQPVKAKAEYEVCAARLRDQLSKDDPLLIKLDASISDLDSLNGARTGESVDAAWQRLEHSGEYWAFKSDRARSERALLAALQLAESLKDSPEKLVQTLTQLGRVYYLLQPVDVPKAKQLFERAEKIIRTMPSPIPTYPEELYHRLVEIYFNQGKTDKIVELSKPWATYWLDKTGALSWQTFDCQQNLINSEITNRQFIEAEQQALDWYVAVQKVPQPLPDSKLHIYAMSVHLLLSAYENQGKWKEAEALLLKELPATSHQKTLRNKLVFAQYAAEIGWFSAHGPAAGAKRVSTCWQQLVNDQLGSTRVETVK